jgi:hypothetical protein
MSTLHLALSLALLSSPVMAQDWQPLKGAEITQALSARVLAYPDGKTQNFFADGRTLYEGGGSSQSGQWRVEGDRYCSVWPPSDRWSCYGVEREAQGLDLRFVDDGGTATAGRYVDLE